MQIIEAIEIARLCVGIPVEEAASLIESFARARASQASYDATAKAYANAIAILNPETLAVSHA